MGQASGLFCLCLDSSVEGLRPEILMEDEELTPIWSRMVDCRSRLYHGTQSDVMSVITCRYQARVGAYDTSQR